MVLSTGAELRPIKQTLTHCFLLIVLSSLASAGFQEYDIYSGEHLDDIIMKTDGSGVTDKNAVLIIYDESCMHAIKDHSLYCWSTPLTKYVAFLKYDYLTSQTNTWYGYNGDDIKERYNITTCWAALYIPAGSTRETPPKRWYPEIGRRFGDWVWDQTRTPVKLTNYNTFRVRVEVTPGMSEGGGPDRYAPFGLDPAEETLVMIPLSYFISIHTWDQMSDKKHYLGIWRVDVPFMEIPTLNNPREDYAYTDERNNLRNLESSDDHYRREWIWTHQQRHLLNLKQPLVTPNLTKTGYLKREIPEQWYQILLNFYKENTKLRQAENWPHIDSVVNHDEIHPTMVHLSELVKELVSRGLQELMEEWCDTQLEMTAFYGIREYYTGNILRHHVDRVETHVISAILQIDKGLGDGEDWLLEVIDYDGNRQEVQLNPGEMLLYESARLIHGRPKAFKGNYFANVFLHYKPATNSWSEKRYRNGMTLYYPENNFERLMPLKSNLTQQHGKKRKLFMSRPENEVKSGSEHIEL